MTLVDLLERAGAVDVTAAGETTWRDAGLGPAEAVRRAEEVADNARRTEDSRIDMMRGFAETTGCRRQYLLSYFGQTLPEPCGYCDACERGTAREQPDADESPFPVGGSVVHASWGRGRVMRYEGDRIVVLFDDVGYRTLALATVVERGLLEVA